MDFGDFIKCIKRIVILIFFLIFFAGYFSIIFTHPKLNPNSNGTDLFFLDEYYDRNNNNNDVVSPSCSICGSPSKRISNTDAIVTYNNDDGTAATTTTTTCGELEILGLEGRLTKDQCTDNESYDSICSCREMNLPSVCSVCGDGKEVSNVDAIFAFPGQPTSSCEELQNKGTNREISNELCPLLPTLIKELCNCQKKTADTTTTTTPAPIPSGITRSPTKAPIISEEEDDDDDQEHQLVSFLTNDTPDDVFYFIELLHYKKNKKNNNNGNNEYYLNSNIIPSTTSSNNNEMEVIIYGSIVENEREFYVTKYISGEYFKNTILSNRTITDAYNTYHSNNLQQYYAYATKLIDNNNQFLPILSSSTNNNNDDDAKKSSLLFHSLSYLNRANYDKVDYYFPQQEDIIMPKDGKDAVKIFDERILPLKRSIGMYALGWFDVYVTIANGRRNNDNNLFRNIHNLVLASGRERRMRKQRQRRNLQEEEEEENNHKIFDNNRYGRSINEIRIEFIPSLLQFGMILQDSTWLEAAAYREAGITSDSTTYFAKPNIHRNQY